MFLSSLFRTLLTLALVGAAAGLQAQNPTVSNKETQIKRFFATMGDASQGHALGKTALAGGTGGTEFSDSLKDGGLLVGFDVWPGTGEIAGIQPIFDTEKGRVRGTKHGNCNGAPTTIEAKEEYAVAGVNANGASFATGFEAIFMKIYHSGMSLDAVGTYKSPWVGAKSGGKSFRLVPGQKPVIGIYGATSGGGIIRMGLLFYDRK
jgi:hypothetical protein